MANKKRKSNYAMSGSRRANLAASLIQNAWRFSRMRKNLKTLRPSNSTGSGSKYSGAGTTDHFDQKKLYSRKRPNKRKVRKYKAFARKVYNVAEKARGKSTLIVNGSETSNSPSPFQIITEVNLYSVNADIQGGRDVDLIMADSELARKTTINTVAGVSERPYSAEESLRNSVHMTSAMVDITWLNDGATDLECDLYTLSHRNVPIGQFIQNSIGTTSAPTSIGQAATAQDQFQIPLTAWNVSANTYKPIVTPNLSNRGTTPFDFLSIKRLTGATVVTKTKFQLPVGHSITRQMSDRKRRTIFPHTSNPQYRYDKNTTTYLMIAKSLTGAIGAAQSLKMSYTKHYRWTAEGIQENKLGFLTNV